jgi:hypothetical protein
MSLSNSTIKFIETNIFAQENMRNEKEKQIASFPLIKFFQILPLLFNKNKIKKQLILNKTMSNQRPISNLIKLNKVKRKTKALFLIFKQSKKINQTN